MRSEDEIKAVLPDEIGNNASEVDLGHLLPDVNFRQKLDIGSMGFFNPTVALGSRLSIQVPECDYPREWTIKGTVAYPVAAKR